MANMANMPNMPNTPSTPNIHNPQPQVPPLYYTDTGCEIAPKCVECPLPLCKYDVPAQQQKSDIKKIWSLALHRQGKTWQEIGKIIGVSADYAKQLADRATQMRVSPFG